mgnify:FL=1
MGPDVIFWNSKFDGLGKKEYKAKDYCLYLFKSPMIVSFDEGEKKLEPWTFILYDIGVTQNFRFAEESGRYDLLHFSGEEVKDFLLEINIPLNQPFQTYNAQYVSELIKHLNRETICEYPFRLITLDTLLRYLLWNIAKSLYDIGSSTQSVRDDYTLELRKLRKMIEASPQEKWTIDRMASMMHISKSFFCRLYMQFHRVSPGQDLQNIRMEQAMYLLSCQGLSVRETAKKIGYENEYYFIRLFRKKYGKTPGEFAREHRGGDVGE